MVKEKKVKAINPIPIKLGGVIKARAEVKVSRKSFKKAREKRKRVEGFFGTGIRKVSTGEKIGPRGLAIPKELEKHIREKRERTETEAQKVLRQKVIKAIEERQKVQKEIGTRIGKKLEKVGQQKMVVKKVLRKQRRGTLDLRRGPEIEVKQHGFKESEIGFRSI